MALENKNYSGSKLPEDREMDGKPLTDGSGVKFIPQDNSTQGKNGDANVELGNLPSHAPFAGMGKEELLKYANEPFWVRLRWALFILFWVAWVGMLAGAIALIVTAPRCPPTPVLPWWQKSPVYKIEGRSFLDSNDDGTGDLKGIESKLDYLQSMDIKTILLGSIFNSSDNMGEDIIGFGQVDSRIGTLEDLKQLITAIHDKGMRLILDFIPNHSSKRHHWFTNNSGKKKNYYVWAKNGKGNNWRNKANNSAWEFDGDGYFYHKFNDSQPDLNWRNESLKAEMDEILRYWLNLGVDGFNMKDVQYLFEDEEQRDETSFGQYTENQKENFVLINSWKELLNSYNESRVLLMDVNVNSQDMIKYFGNSVEVNGSKGGDLVINNQLAHLKEGVTGFQISEAVNSSMLNIPMTEWSSWVISDSTSGHVATRFPITDLIDTFNALLLLLKGTPITYYGDEIGLADNPDLSSGESPFTPMSWENKTNAGFSNSTSPWLTPNPNYVTVNVQNQINSGDKSHLNFYKQLSKLRTEPSIQYGNGTIKLVNHHIFSFLREAHSNPKFLVLLNVKNETYTITENDVKMSELPESGKLHLKGSKTELSDSLHSVITLTNFKVPPLAVLILKI